MPLWEDFLNSIKGLGQGIAQLPGAVIGNVATSGAQLGTSQLYKGNPQAAAAAGIAAEMGTQKALEKAGIATLESTGAKVVDPVLFAGEQLNKYVFSPIITRPISTANLLADPSSPLYKTEEYGKGFQFSDVIDAYNRTERVSLGVSLLKNPLSPLGGFESLILKNGGIDRSKSTRLNSSHRL